MNPTTINPNANYFSPGQGGNPTFQIPQTSSTINAGTLEQNAPTMSFPTTPTTLDAMSANTSVSTPIPTPESIVNSETTSTDQKKQSVLDWVTKQVGLNKTQTQLQNEAGQAAGLPQQASVVNDLNTQLEGLNNQATALQNEATYTIPNAAQNSVEGRGVTAGGLAPVTASQLRANQIKQGAIATQSLTVKSALYGAMGKYSLAKDAADKAATAQYEVQQQQIDYAKAQLDALAPTLNREEKARAAIQQAKLADRQTQIDNAKEDKKTILAMATAALKNNPNDPQAQYAAQQALAESNSQQPDLQKALGLIGKYQQDPLAIQKQIAEITQTRTQTDKLNAEIGKINAETNKTKSESIIPTVTNPQASQYSGALNVILGSDKFTSEQKKAVINSVNNGQDPVATIKNQAKNVMGQTQSTKLSSLESSRDAFTAFTNSLKAFYDAGGKTSYISGNLEKVYNNLGQVKDPNLVQLATELQGNIQSYRNAISGTAYSEQEGKDISSIFPGINKTQSLNDAIIKGRTKLFDSSIDGIYRSVLGTTYDSLKQTTKQSGGSTSVTAPDGVVYNFPDQASADAFKKSANIK
jgi:hypothetical protein